MKKWIIGNKHGSMKSSKPKCVLGALINVDFCGATHLQWKLSVRNSSCDFTSLQNFIFSIRAKLYTESFDDAHFTSARAKQKEILTTETYFIKTPQI